MIVKPDGELFSAGRLSKPMSELLREHNEKPRLEWEKRHLSTILQVDKAHTVMLAEQKLVDRVHARAILQELECLRKTPLQDLPIQPGYGSMVLQIERLLGKKLGEDIAGNMPIARSRLDQGATVRRIVDRGNVLRVSEALMELQGTIVRLAGVYSGTLMISYTHLQQAQPADFGHYLLAFRDRLADSQQQLRELYHRVNRSPLGAVGLSGTDLHIDRQRTASLLGFDSVLENSRLGRDGYYQIEFCTTLSMIMTVLNDLCSELHIHSSSEFGTVELDDGHCSTSSIFPQKKNPYALETIKGKAGESHGWVAAALATFRNEGTIDHAARTVACLENACHTTVDMMMLMSEILENLTVHVERFEQLLQKAWVTTNRLANVLMTNHGLCYRSAHSVVARLVRNCLLDGVDRAQVTSAMLRQAAAEMGVQELNMDEAELVAALDHHGFVQSSASTGGVGPQEVARMISRARQQLQDDRALFDNETLSLLEAQKQLESAAQGIQDPPSYADQK